MLCSRLLRSEPALPVRGASSGRHDLGQSGLKLAGGWTMAAEDSSGSLGGMMDVDAEEGSGGGAGEEAAPASIANGGGLDVLVPLSHTPPHAYSFSPSMNPAGKRGRFTSPMISNAYHSPAPSISREPPHMEHPSSAKSAYGSIDFGGISRSGNTGGGLWMDKGDPMENPEERRTRINNSTSSVFAQSTIFTPDASQILLCMSAVIKIQMEHDCNSPLELKLRFSVFDKEVEATAADGLDSAGMSTTLDEIHEFLYMLFKSAKFSPECNIIALVYINRVIAKTGMPLYDGNWRAVVIAAFILAQKVWDDRCLATGTFATICPMFSKEQVRVFERSFLELLDYQAVVSRSLYTKYYFELRELFEHLMKEQKIEFPIQPLSLWRAKQLELYSDSFRMQRSSNKLGGDTKELLGGTASSAPITKESSEAMHDDPDSANTSPSATPDTSRSQMSPRTLEDVTYTPRGRYVQS